MLLDLLLAVESIHHSRELLLIVAADWGEERALAFGLEVKGLVVACALRCSLGFTFSEISCLNQDCWLNFGHVLHALPYRRELPTLLGSLVLRGLLAVEHLDHVPQLNKLEPTFFFVTVKSDLSHIV